MIETAVYDSKPYDRGYLAQAPGAERIDWRFHEFRLSAETAAAAKGAQAVCEALGEIARVTTANVLQLETGEPFLAGTTL